MHLRKDIEIPFSGRKEHEKQILFNFLMISFKDIRYGLGFFFCTTGVNVLAFTNTGINIFC